MRTEGSERLITTLTGEVDGVLGHRAARAGEEPNAPSAPLTGHGQNGGAFHDEQRNEAVDIPRATLPAAPDTSGRKDVASPVEDDLNPQALQLSRDERNFMLNFLPLVGTPRAAKRFSNTYQLLRVSVREAEASLDNREYEPVLILLALMMGTAPMTDEMIGQLRSVSEATFERFLTSRTEVGWQQILSACEKLPTETLNPAHIRTWLPKVARYSFHPVEV